MKYFLISIVMSLSVQTSFADVNWTRQARPVVHKVSGDETLWFIAQVYYKKGENYQKIMAANGLKNPNDIKLGTMLMIPNPLFSNHDQNFQARYNMIHKIREDKLNTMNPTPQNKNIGNQMQTELPLKKRSPASEIQAQDTKSTENEPQNNDQITDSENNTVRRFIAE